MDQADVGSFAVWLLSETATVVIAEAPTYGSVEEGARLSASSDPLPFSMTSLETVRATTTRPPLPTMERKRLVMARLHNRQKCAGEALQRQDGGYKSHMGVSEN